MEITQEDEQEMKMRAVIRCCLCSRQNSSRVLIERFDYGIRSSEGMS